MDHLRQPLDVDGAAECMTAAWEAGVNFFDNAETYARGAAEEIMGGALRKLGWRRSSFLISTKFFWGLHRSVNERNTLNRKRLIEGIDGSLKRLQLEYVDLVFCHRPDPHTPVEETAWAMHNIIERRRCTGDFGMGGIGYCGRHQIAERHLHKPVVRANLQSV
jgi:aryl-alcohol dehydrogenase-like predicted oxidoreductase